MADSNVVVDITRKDYTWATCSNTWEETASTWETAGLQIINVTSDDAVSFKDSANNNPIKYIKDAFSTSDARPDFQTLCNISESVNVMETYWDNIFYILRVLENIGFNERLLKLLWLPIKERFAISFKNYSNNVALKRQDVILLGDSINKRGLILWTDNISADDSKVIKSLEIELDDYIYLLDKMLGQIDALFKDTVTIAEEYSKIAKYSKDVDETFLFNEEQFKQILKINLERISVTDFLRNRFTQLKKEEIGIIDIYVKKFIASKLFSEKCIVSEFQTKNIGLVNQEAIAVYDALIRAANGVLSNIAISDEPIDLNAFKQVINLPSGYSPFMNFKVGEYEYQDALIRLVMEASVKQSQPTVSSVVLHVDIPDTDDRGVVEITSTTGPTKVYFNKHYYNPPEVNVTLKAGNTSNGVLVPNIVSTDQEDDAGRYFEVELWNESWSQRKTGTISWFSKGY